MVSRDRFANSKILTHDIRYHLSLCIALSLRITTCIARCLLQIVVSLPSLCLQTLIVAMRRLFRSIDRPSSSLLSTPATTSRVVVRPSATTTPIASLPQIRSLATPPIASVVDPSARVTFERNLKRAQAGLPLEV
jgi:hypothetical protein